MKSWARGIEFRMFDSTDPFVKFLRSQNGAKAYLKPYWGNSGDVLIWMGNELLLKEIGLERVVDPRKADIIVWPGGNPSMWRGNLDAWQDCWRCWPDARFVVAPATFQGNAWQQSLKDAPQNVVAEFSRDPSSHQNLSSAHLRPGIETGLGHDPAFHLKDSNWASKHRDATTSEYVLASFRDDHESTFSPVIENRLFSIWPFSSVLVRLQHRRKRKFCQHRLKLVRDRIGSNERIFECDAPMMSFESFVECVRRASQVHTDRLHCMILAVLLGKEVFAYPTAYGKLEAVYEHSIKSWAKVNFISN